MTCAETTAVFSTREGWVQHLAEQHAFAPDWQGVDCLLCAEPIPNGKVSILRHLAAHLEEISLATLPVYAESDTSSESTEDEKDDSSPAGIQQPEEGENEYVPNHGDAIPVDGVRDVEYDSFLLQFIQHSMREGPHSLNHNISKQGWADTNLLYRCGECHKVLESPTALEFHGMSEGHLPFICKCGDRFEEFGTFLRHVVSMPASPGSPKADIGIDAIVPREALTNPPPPAPSIYFAEWTPLGMGRDNNLDPYAAEFVAAQVQAPRERSRVEESKQNSSAGGDTEAE